MSLQRSETSAQLSLHHEPELSGTSNYPDHCIMKRQGLGLLPRPKRSITVIYSKQAGRMHISLAREHNDP